jgi:hypothetical protein
MNLKELALQVINRKLDRKPEGNNTVNGRKLLPPKSTEKFPPKNDTNQRKYGVPYLDDQGRFCVKSGCHRPPILDRLLELGASDAEIERHIGPLHHEAMWQQWQQIKNQRLQ